MTKGALGQVVKQAISDAAFRRQLQSDPEGALKGFDLSGDERAALRSGDASKLTSLGIDQRMSKIFAAAEGAAVVSKWGTGSDLSMGANVPDGGDTSVTDALVSGGGGRANDALISEASGAKGARISDAGGSVRTALGDQHDGGRAAIGDSASGGRTALDNSSMNSREGTAFITADEQGNNVVADGTTANWSAAPIDGGPEGHASIAADTAGGGRQTDAFLTADELGNDVVASGTGDAGLQARIVDSADVQREALDAGTSMANPEGYDRPDPNAA